MARLDRVAALFDQAAGLPADARESFLREQCAGSDSLLAYVRDLLRHLDAAGTAGDEFLERPITQSVSVLSGFDAENPPERGDATHEIPQTRIGHYRILRLIGEGGMGQVFEAEQDQPHRVVALKLVRLPVSPLPRLTPSHLLARFEHEAEMLGQLRHPGIAHIYEAGSVQTPLGPQPFFAMELIDGLPITAYADRHKLGTRQRLQLIVKVCEAVHHAHQKGVIHRDLKPGNILVDESAGGGQPKVLDFGVARAIKARDGVALQTMSLRTGVGQLMGTVPYMSPEQVSGEPAQIDIRSDIYAIGVLLYELLSGRLPHEVRDKPIPEAARIIRDEDPARLSSINAVFRGDVETIVSKAIAKEKDLRYQSAAELAADIWRYLADQPISARPLSTFYQLRKFARRNKALVGGALTTMLALVIGIIGVSVLASREARQRRVADALAADAQRQAYRSSLTAALAAIQNHDAALAQRSLDAAPPALRGWEWRHLNWLADRSLLTLSNGGQHPRCLTLSPDDRFLAAGGFDGMLRIWDMTSGQLLHERRMGSEEDVSQENGVRGVAMSPNASLLLTSSNNELIMSRRDDGQQLWRRTINASVGDRAFHPDSSRVVVGHVGASQIIVLNAHTGDPLSSFHVHDPQPGAVGFSADGQRIVVSLAWSDTALILDAHDGETIRTLPGPVWRFCGAGTAVAVADGEGIATFDLTDGDETARWRGRWAPNFAVDASLQRLVLANGSAVTLWEPHAQRPLTTLLGHERGVVAIAAAQTVPHLVTASDDGVIKVWNTRACDAPWTVPETNDAVFASAFTADGRRLTTGGWGAVKMWDTSGGAELWTTMVSRKYLRAAAFNHAGDRLAVADEDGQIVVLDAHFGQVLLRDSPLNVEVRDLAWIANDRLCIASEGSAAMRVIDMSSAESARTTLDGHRSGVHALAASSDGSLLASAGDVVGNIAGVADDGGSAGNETRIVLWDTATLQRQRVLPGHIGAVTALAFSADGSRLASGSEIGETIIWDVATGRRLSTLAQGSSTTGPAVASLAFTPDGSRLAGGCSNATLRIWDVDQGHEVIMLNMPRAGASQVRFTADGQSLLVSGPKAPLVAFETAAPAEGFESRELVREARAWIERAGGRFALVQELIQQAERDPTLPEPLRGTVMALVRARGDQVNYMNSQTWFCVRLPGRPASEYQQALLQAKRTCELWPDDQAMLNTLALAQYRCGEFASVLHTLERCAAIARQQQTDPHPADVLLMAMTQHRMGQTDEAQQSLKAARQSMLDPQFSGDGDLQALLHEAQNMIERSAR